MSVPRQQPRVPNAAQEILASRRRLDRLETTRPTRVGSVTAVLGAGKVTVDVSSAQDGSRTVDAAVAPAGLTVFSGDVVVVLPVPRALSGATWVALPVAAGITVTVPATADGTTPATDGATTSSSDPRTPDAPQLVTSDQSGDPPVAVYADDGSGFIYEDV